MKDSNLERGFLLWLRQERLIPEPVREHVFAPPRKWRLDFAWPDALFAVEIDGGLYSAGRHNRPKGYIEDCEKYEAAMLLGWTVYRIPGPWVSEGSTWVWRPETMAAIRQMLGIRAAP